MSTETSVAHKYIFGNIHPENVVLPDLEVGPDSAKQAVVLKPGEVVDLADFFDEKDLTKSRSLKIALKDGLLKPCKSVDEHLEVAVMQLKEGIAAPNVFDRKLKAALIKEKEEEDRLKAGRDGLAARVKDIDI